jgi:hypothetical protein
MVMKERVAMGIWQMRSEGDFDLLPLSSLFCILIGVRQLLLWIDLRRYGVHRGYCSSGWMDFLPGD